MQGGREGEREREVEPSLFRFDFGIFLLEARGSRRGEERCFFLPPSVSHSVCLSESVCLCVCAQEEKKP
mgnify:CR=1 FL=1